MPEGQVLEFSAVTKRFGAVTAVDGFTARVEPGLVTGFLGPNGAGKTTTLRILLGPRARRPRARRRSAGVPYAKLANPLQTVGAVLEASSFHPGRTAANHLKVYAQAAGLPASRVDEALGLVGLARRRAAARSADTRSACASASASPTRCSAIPGVLVLDEPANGLDPEGIKWMRGLLRDLARAGPHRARLVAPARRGAADRRLAADHRDRTARLPGRASTSSPTPTSTRRSSTRPTVPPWSRR